MAYIEWDKKYSVGIKAMDNQHKKLIDIINKLHNRVSSGFAHEALQETFSELADYTVYHFTVEEGIMSQYDFPDLSSHKKEHEKIIKKLQDIRLQFEEEKSEFKIIIMLETFLNDWLINHITNLDKKYGSYINGKRMV